MVQLKVNVRMERFDTGMVLYIFDPWEQVLGNHIKGILNQVQDGYQSKRSIGWPNGNGPGFISRYHESDYE